MLLANAMQSLKTRKTLIFVMSMLLVAVLSTTVLARVFSSSQSYLGQYQVLDEKRDNVMKLTASSAGIAALISAAPGDLCTPLAEELADISKGFGIVLGALLLEKYLLTTIGSAFFTVVVPCCCLLVALTKLLSATNTYRHVLQQAALKFLLFGLVLFLSIPASVYVSSKIDETYDDTVAATLADAQEASDAVEVKSVENESNEAEDGILEFVADKLNSIGDGVKSAVATANDVVVWAQTQVSNFLESLAVMFVTSVVIPLVVPIVIYLAFRTLFGQQQYVMMQSTSMPVPVAPLEQVSRGEVAVGDSQDALPEGVSTVSPAESSEE